MHYRLSRIYDRLGKPDLAAWHDVPNSPGIVDIVRGNATIDEALRIVPGARGMVLLPAGEAQVDPAPLFFDAGTVTVRFMSGR